VQLVETHISWVFLVGDLAYKLKKPVKLDFLDFSTPALRQHFCEEELRLNRRFAPGLYLGLSTLVETATGLAVDAPGRVVDHAVRMRRFDREQELDALLARDAVDAPLLEDFGRRLARQHESAPRAGTREPWARPGRTLEACRENFTALRRVDDPALQERVERLSRWTESAFRRLLPRLERRRLAGRFRECHGDLHCANVVRHDGEFWAFDALEFDPGLHWIDVANDLAFLYMDLRVRGHPGLAAALLDGWLSEGGDYDALGVLPFYDVYRAAVRAKVAAIRAGQHPGRGTGDREGIERYLRYATEALSERPRHLVAMTGPSGAGKSRLAARLLAPLEAVRIRSDVERKRLAGLAPGDAGDAKLYSSAMTARTYAQLRDLAASALRDGASVVVDAASLRADERRGFAAVAREAGVPFTLLSLVADRDLLARRIRARQAAGGDPSEATVDVMERQLRQAEPLQPDELPDAIRLDAAADIHLPGLVRRIRRDVAPGRAAPGG